MNSMNMHDVVDINVERHTPDNSEAVTIKITQRDYRDHDQEFQLTLFTAKMDAKKRRKLIEALL